MGVRITVALLLGLAACRDAPKCPPGAARDAVREARLGRLAQLSDPPRVCFGVVSEPSLREDGVALLPSDLDERDAAAWLAHLAHHARAGLPTRHLTPPCDAGVARAMADERAAVTVENATRRRLGLEPRDAAAQLERLEAAYTARCR